MSTQLGGFLCNNMKNHLTLKNQLLQNLLRGKRKQKPLSQISSVKLIPQDDVTPSSLSSFPDILLQTSWQCPNLKNIILIHFPRSGFRKTAVNHSVHLFSKLCFQRKLYILEEINKIGIKNQSASNIGFSILFLRQFFVAMAFFPLRIECFNCGCCIMGWLIHHLQCLHLLSENLILVLATQFLIELLVEKLKMEAAEGGT